MTERRINALFSKPETVSIASLFNPKCPELTNKQILMNSIQNMTVGGRPTPRLQPGDSIGNVIDHRRKKRPPTQSELLHRFNEKQSAKQRMEQMFEDYDWGSAEIKQASTTRPQDIPEVEMIDITDEHANPPPAETMVIQVRHEQRSSEQNQ